MTRCSCGIYSMLLLPCSALDDDTLGAVHSMLPCHGLCDRACTHRAAYVYLWSNFSALASPPRRRRLAVSFMDRSSPPSGRLAAVLDRCLRFAYYGLMESLYRAPCLHCAGRTSLHSQLIPYPRYAAAPSHARCAPARAARGACPPSPPSCNREIPSRICDTHPRD